MLINFTLGNYRSFKTNQNISMKASSIAKEDFLPQNKIKYNENESYLKTALVYGANSSGKTNIVNGISTLRKIVLRANNLEKNLTSEIIPFLLDKNYSEGEPTNFEIYFIENNMKYRYGLSILKGVISAEWLYVKKDRETQLFEREYQKIDYNKTGFTEAKIFIDGDEINRTPEHVPFVSTLASFDGEHSTNVINFLRRINILSGLNDKQFSNYTFRLLANNRDFKNFVLKVLQDFYIEDIIVSDLQTEEDDDDDIKINFSYRKEVEIVKRIPNSEETVITPLSFESSGTRKILHLLGPFYDTCEKGKILVIDEFDSKFHTLLTKEIIKLFHKNSVNSQIIMNVQDTNLMDTSILRRDQIWFTHKPKIEQDSRIYSLIEYKDIIKDSYSSDYLSGDFDAIPIFQSLSDIEKLMGDQNNE